MEMVLVQLFGWIYPLLMIVVIVLAATRKSFSGKPWLVAHLVVGLVVTIAWRMPGMLRALGLDFDVSSFYRYGSIPLNILGIAGLCMLIPFVLMVAGSGTLSGQTGSMQASGNQAGPPPLQNINNPLCGVHGWLRFFVIIHMFVVPIIFVISQVAGFISIGIVFDRYPGLLVVGIIEAIVGIFLVVKWIMIARRLDAIAPGIVQETRRWLIISLCWGILSLPLVFMSGVDPEFVIPGVVKQFVVSIISFAIWYSYFNVSKRVKATYPDWDQ